MKIEVIGTRGWSYVSAEDLVRELGSRFVRDGHDFTIHAWATDETINQGMPIVMFDRVVNEIDCDKVIVDDLKGSKKAVEKLISNGCKNIAIITTKDYVTVGKLRTQGYIEALKEHNLQQNASLILKIDVELDSEDHFGNLENEIEQFFKNNENIDGIFAVNELYAITAMKVAKKHGMEIPENIQIIGFTDGVLSKHATPSLSTVSQHAQEMGEKAADLLIDRLELEVENEEYEEEEENYQTVIIETELIERDSTK
ncbi:MAG: substrate-binding domain-containing protein [Bacteroidetes bacterium]|nr:substrate-binding domain-containing protein [Bacteroidota bacterium]